MTIFEFLTVAVGAGMGIFAAEWLVNTYTRFRMRRSLRRIEKVADRWARSMDRRDTE